MAFNFSRFLSLNVTDCCALWNLLSSELLFHAARRANFYFCITHFVFYEALLKKRSCVNEKEQRLIARLKKALSLKDVEAFHLSIDDLQEVDIIEKRRQLGKGEISSIAFAKRTRQAFMTDDKKARKLAHEILGEQNVQTVPHLVGWLFYSGNLTDGDKTVLLAQHEEMERPLKQYFEEMYQKAMEKRLAERYN